MLGIWRMKNGKAALVCRNVSGRLPLRGAFLMPVAWTGGGSFNLSGGASPYDLDERIVCFDDLVPVCDLLEEQGFDEVAQFLRALAEAGDEPSERTGA